MCITSVFRTGSDTRTALQTQRAENSAEYRTLIELTNDVRLAVRSDLISLSGALLSAGLISPDNDAELRNTVHSEAERAARLVELVQIKVRQNSRHYHTFVDIILKDQDLYTDILEKLNRHFHVIKFSMGDKKS